MEVLRKLTSLASPRQAEGTRWRGVGGGVCLGIPLLHSRLLGPMPLGLLSLGGFIELVCY